MRIQEATEPVAIRDLRTGQHVQCLNSTGDLRVPVSATFCEVINWVRPLCAQACFKHKLCGTSKSIGFKVAKPYVACGP